MPASLRGAKLHSVCDGQGRPVLLHLTAGQISDYTGARKLLGELPAAKTLVGERGYDANWFRGGLQEKGIAPCIPPRRIENAKFLTIKPCINNTISSKTCSAGSRIGGAEPPAMTAVRTASNPQSASLQPSFGGCDES